MKDIQVLTILAILTGVFMIALNPIAPVNAQPYYDAYFTGISITHGNDAIDLIGGGVAKVYAGQRTWKNLTFYNEDCGLFGGDLYTKIYRNDVYIATSDERYVLLETYGYDDWWTTEYDADTYDFKVELWWESYGTHYLEDVKYFSVKVVKLFVVNWLPASLSVQKGETTPSTLSISFENGGNDYMYDTTISVVDSAGLEISPQSQNLGDVSSGGTKSTSFSAVAPSTAPLGSHTLEFKTGYKDFRGLTHYETETAVITVDKIGTNIALSLNPSSVIQGKPVTLEAILEDGNGDPLQNMDVEFQVYETGSWKKIDSARTDSVGVASLTYTPSTAGTFEIKAVFKGATDYAQSTSSARSLDVSVDYTPYLIAGGIAVLGAGGVAGYLMYRRRARAEPKPAT